VQSGDVITLVCEFSEKGQGVLAPGQGREDFVLLREHAVLTHGLLNLPGKEHQKTFPAESGIVAWQGYLGGRFAPAAFHGVKVLFLKFMDGYLLEKIIYYIAIPR